MSIIHDALKKVQQGLNPKAKETPANPPPAGQITPGSLYQSPLEVETLPSANKEEAPKKPSLPSRIKSVLAFIIAAAITAVSIFYIWQEFKSNVPQAQILAKRSFYQLIRKIHPVNKAAVPESLGPLAKIVIPPVVPVPVPVPAAASPAEVPAPATSITLNVHGIMSNATGNLALINDQVYQEGDEVDGAKIIKINLDSITVSINGTEKTIFVKN